MTPHSPYLVLVGAPETSRRLPETWTLQLQEHKFQHPFAGTFIVVSWLAGSFIEQLVCLEVPRVPPWRPAALPTSPPWA